MELEKKCLCHLTLAKKTDAWQKSLRVLGENVQAHSNHECDCAWWILEKFFTLHWIIIINCYQLKDSRIHRLWIKKIKISESYRNGPINVFHLIFCSVMHGRVIDQNAMLVSFDCIDTSSLSSRENRNLIHHMTSSMIGGAWIIFPASLKSRGIFLGALFCVWMHTWKDWVLITYDQ